MEIISCEDCGTKLGYIECHEYELALCIECRKKQHEKDLGGATCLLTESDIIKVEKSIDANKRNEWIKCLVCGIGVYGKDGLLTHFRKRHKKLEITQIKSGNTLQCLFCIKTIDRANSSHIYNKHESEYKQLKLLEKHNLLSWSYVNKK